MRHDMTTVFVITIVVPAHQVSPVWDYKSRLINTSVHVLVALCPQHLQGHRESMGLARSVFCGVSSAKSQLWLLLCQQVAGQV